MKDDEHVDMSGVEMSQLLSDVSCSNAYLYNVIILQCISYK